MVNVIGRDRKMGVVGSPATAGSDIHEENGAQGRRMPLKIVIFTVVLLFVKISCTGVPGQAKPDDPHSCFWFTELDEVSVFRCCDGYFKINATKLTENCIACPSGFYGFNCESICTCENGGICDTVDGSCLCSARYFGNNCQYSCNCQNGATCKHDGECLCVDGFYGKLCQEKCSCPENSVCNSKTGKCICKDGFYGNLCLPCQCSDTEQCDPSSGSCSCKPGYYGQHCDKQCSCFNGAYCGDDPSMTCDCSPGWVGSGCTDCYPGIVESNGHSFCDNKCLHCYNGDGCSIANGDCLCSPGWQGYKCDEKCEPGFYGNNCSEPCQCKHGICDHMTGTCQCESGWIGQHCEEPCPNCLVCKADICTSCKSGWTGEHCSNTCKPGFHGDSCREICTECNCSKSCHHVNGSCPYVVRCEENKCKHQNARVCIENPFQLECQVGWTGHVCDVKFTMTSTKGRVYLDVTQTDSQDGTLRPTDDGYVAHDSYSHSGIITAAVSVLVVVISIVIVCLILLRKKKSIPSKFGKDNGTTPYSDRRKGNATSAFDGDTSEPDLLRKSAAATDNIKECERFIDTDVKGALPIYASVYECKKMKLQSNAIKENNQHTEPVEYEAWSKATISTHDDDDTNPSLYESISLKKLNFNVDLSDNDTEYENLSDDTV